jgi:hypothetical protein
MARTSRVAMTDIVALGFNPMNAKGRKTIVLKMIRQVVCGARRIAAGSIFSIALGRRLA